MERIEASPLTAVAFAPFGDVIDFDREPDFAINNGMCDRYHALARADVVGTDAQTIISLGRAKPYDFPLTLKMVERHPYGSQTFIPLGNDPFLVVVAHDDMGVPTHPQAFITSPQQGVNYHRNTWHAVLTPLTRQADFLIIDRDGVEENLEEFFFDMPFEIMVPNAVSVAD